MVYHNLEELKYTWEDRFQSEYGVFRSEVNKAFRDFLNCGILYHGCAMARCESCSHSELIAFSCKKRGICPSCDAKRAVIFAEHLYQNVLPHYPTSHIVFTIPKRLRVFFKYNRKLTKHLYTAAWNTWKELIEDAFPDCESGMIMSLHTAGDLLNFHPHVHALAVYGAVDTSGNFYSLDSVNTDWLNTVFARNLFEALVKEELLDRDTVKSMQSWHHSGFNIWVGDPINYSDTDSLKFLARYLKKAPVSNQRIEFFEDLNTVRYIKYTDSGKEHKDFDPLHFLAEVSQHIPNKWEQTVRYMGICSARTRGAAKNNSVIHAPLQIDTDKPAPSRTWAACMKKIFEFDPLVCPKCGANMKIKAFITDSKEITRITEHHKLPAWRAPPPIKKKFLA